MEALDTAVFIPNAIAFVLITFAHRLVILVGAGTGTGNATSATPAGLQQWTLLAGGGCTANSCIDAIVHKKRCRTIVLLRRLCLTVGIAVVVVVRRRC